MIISWIGRVLQSHSFVGICRPSYSCSGNKPTSRRRKKEEVKTSALYVRRERAKNTLPTVCLWHKLRTSALCRRSPFALPGLWEKKHDHVLRSHGDEVDFDSWTGCLCVYVCTVKKRYCFRNSEWAQFDFQMSRSLGCWNHHSISLVVDIAYTSAALHGILKKEMFYPSATLVRAASERQDLT